MQELERIVKKARAGLLPVGKASHIIWETVFRKKKSFGLTGLTEDGLSEFLLYVQKEFPRIIFSYNESGGCFYSYLRSKILSSLKSWRRTYLKQKAARETLNSCMNINYDLIQGKYEDEEPFTREEKDSHSINDLKLLVSSFSEHKKSQKIKTKNVSEYSQKREKILRRESVLLLALKACTDLTPDMIERVSILTGKSEKEIIELSEAAKETIITKKQRRELYSKTRDNSFFFHRKYFIEKSRLDLQSSMGRRISRIYRKQTNAWIQSNRKLSSSICTLTPSTRTVAQLLKIIVRHAHYVLSHIPANMDKIRLKWYALGHENISCKRKSEQKA